MFFRSYWILGLNARNLKYIKGGDFAVAKKLADSKLKTKKFLASHKVAVPETLGILKKHSEVDVEKIKAYEPPFVIKPNNGYGGKGILVIDSLSAEWKFITNSWESFTPQELSEHFIYILDGFFSLSWGRDQVIIEKKIILTKEVELFGKFGLPDIRIIAYNMVPVMAMIRIPTAESEWKANIHVGACAAWIDIGTGRITYIYRHRKIVKSIPGIWDVRGIIIPEWDKVLSLAVQVQQVTWIKFLGCDVVLDEKDGPLLLEINVRPGPEIQNVNIAPLRVRLDKVEWVDINSVEKWVRLGRDLFSWDIEERIKSLSGKKVAWSQEYLKITLKEKTYNYIADIRSSLAENFIDTAFAEEVLQLNTKEKKSLRLDCEMLGTQRSLRFVFSDLEGEKIRLGKQALKGFLIDPYKYKKWETPFLLDAWGTKGANTAIKKTHKTQLLALDKAIMSIDKKLLILKHVTPTNIASEKQIFIEKQGDYVPSFEYRDISLDLDELYNEIRLVEIPDIPLAEIYAKKQEEVIHKIKFLKAFKEQNPWDMTLYSRKIFWDIERENFDTSKGIIENRDQIVEEEEMLSYEDIKDYMKKFNHIYNIKVKIVEADSTARFTMKGDQLIFRKWATVGKREMRSIIAHEIEGHYLRKVNGRKSDFSILARGAAKYIETDEGIAIYNQNRFVWEHDRKYSSIFERYYFVQYGLKHSYRRLVKHLAEFYNDDYERVFTYMLRLKRWFKDPSKEGVFMKDVVYVNGFKSVSAYIEQGWSLKDLYIWKVHLDDLDLMTGESFFSQHKKDVVIPFSA